MAKRTTQPNWQNLIHNVINAKTPQAKQLAESKLAIANQKLITQTRDRIRKYNAKYGTSYVLNISSMDLKDPKLTVRLQSITTKNIKQGALEDLSQRYEIHGVQLTKEEYTTMRALENKANKQRGYKYYKPYFNNKKGYDDYIKILKKVSTREGYLRGIFRGLQTFKQNLLNHLDDLAKVEDDADKLAEIDDLFNWVNNNFNTYSRLDIAYKFFLASGYTAEKMARIFFDSDPTRNKFMMGEDVEFIMILKNLRRQHPWATPATRLTQLDRDYPIDI